MRLPFTVSINYFHRDFASFPVLSCKINAFVSRNETPIPTRTETIRHIQCVKNLVDVNLEFHTGARPVSFFTCGRELTFIWGGLAHFTSRDKGDLWARTLTMAVPFGEVRNVSVNVRAR